MSNEKHAKCANIQKSKILPRVEIFREIFPEEEGNHSNVNEPCGPRCGGEYGYGMFIGIAGK